MSSLIIGCMIIGAAVVAWVAWLVLKAVVISAAKLVAASYLPVELKMLEWLQDRAVARTLGIDVEVVAARRRIDTANKPIDTHSQKAPNY